MEKPLTESQHAELIRLRYEVKAARSEITKLHRQMNALQKAVRRELAATRRAALEQASNSTTSIARPAAPSSGDGMLVTPVGHIESCFVNRNGTPRQPGLAPAARSRLQLKWGTAPAHTLDGLEQFSHVWLLFLFHRNRGDEVVKAKVQPPRLGGERTGVFACRTPHRPNPIGLSLVRLERVDGETLHLHGADLIDGTPILDVKPFLPYADAPGPNEPVRAPEWVAQGAMPRVKVTLTEEARRGLREACSGSSDSSTTAAQEEEGGEAAPAAEEDDDNSHTTTPLRFFCNRASEFEAALVELLRADPRSVYRKHKCAGQEYRVVLDGLEAVCRFGEADDGGGSEVADEVTVEAVHVWRPSSSAEAEEAVDL